MLYAIADLHLPSTLGKTMDRFGSAWENHPEKVRKNWLDRVGPEDSVLVCGDISWAMKIEEARPDLEFLAGLPGTKYLIRGNHDFWWRRSTTRSIQQSLPPHIVLIQGEGRVVEGVAIGGTRGWQVEDRIPQPHDEKILRRELGYLRQAFAELPESPRVAMLHYPPYNPDLQLNEFGRLLLELKVELTVFGHLHVGNPNVLAGPVESLELQLVAADRVDFCPQPLRLAPRTSYPGPVFR
ncbi:MAG TPA: metallophosphoesterase [Armatimonadota bacterium]|nr:metallophosphoesterase [Armatimonadota bacterium]